ncbi:MAG: 2-oxoglutarate dehydrogenase E1 component [Planctomycetaceae bacterium]
MNPELATRISSGSLSYLEDLYHRFLAGDGSVPAEWAAYFRGLTNGNGHPVEPIDVDVGPFPRHSVFNPPGGGAPPASNGSAADRLMAVASQQEKLDQLIRNFRVRGHIMAQVDPLGVEKPSPPELLPEYYGFSEADLDRDMSTDFVGGPEIRTLRGIINWMKQTYCRGIGVQFMHIDSLTDRSWLQMRMETTGNRIKLSRDEQIRILQRLADAVHFEEFIARKFVGAKSFSLEGAESLIPLLDMAIEKCGNEGVREIVIGMAHRGRLNVLANIMGKSPREIFREFDDNDPHLHLGRGDVKYHLGYSRDWETTKGNSVHLSLCFNPSHLEFVNTVSQGRVRAKQDRFKDFNRNKGVCFLIHGDAAFAGEGIVQETLNLSKLNGYRTGGTIHIIVNNQIGFTTSPNEGRSTIYASDVAKMLQSPIFHVNGEDPEAVAQVITLSLDFRKKFKRDVVINMYCYRRRGHNEGDEPAFTQPVMYRKIRERPSVFEGYLDKLLELRGLTREEADRINEVRRESLERELTEARRDDYVRCFDHLGGVWSGYINGPVSEADSPKTGVDKARLQNVLRALCQIPDGFIPHPKVERLLASRLEMADGKQPLDWGMAELAAFGTVLAEGTPFRMTGQDVRRGTFSQRHAVLYNYETGKPLVTLKNIAPEKGRVNLYNSPLSEAGVLGFEYGYSLDAPEGLTIWEAQFGDFWNCAQVIVDQFIASAEDKWDRLSGLVMLLPHGFEGQGPEHSSARLERFLNLAAEDNIQIAQPSTPAQHFHMLRRQVLRKWKKPLVVMTPKSLLRLPACVSPLDDLVQGSFQEVIGDTSGADPATIKRVLLCSGRVYYDLIRTREETGRRDIAIVRMEQFYPFPQAALEQALAPYGDNTEAVWVQDEPENMGAWGFLKLRFCHRLLDRFPFRGVTRPASASPATGSGRSHRVEQDRLLAAAFAQD